MDYREVFLLKAPVPDLTAQSSGGIPVQRVHHDAADGLVQTVNAQNLRDMELSGEQRGHAGRLRIHADRLETDDKAAAVIQNRNIHRFTFIMWWAQFTI